LFQDAGNGVFVFCDDQSGTVRVGVKEPLIPGFLPQFREVARFASHQEWVRSPFCERVSPSIQDMIDWFWVDLATIRSG